MTPERLETMARRLHPPPLGDYEKLATICAALSVLLQHEADKEARRLREALPAE